MVDEELLKAFESKLKGRQNNLQDYRERAGEWMMGYRASMNLMLTETVTISSFNTSSFDLSFSFTTSIHDNKHQTISLTLYIKPATLAEN